MAKVSIIMPAFNASGYISESITSVLAQSFTDFELIIVDDCSTDNTVQLCEVFRSSDSRIVLLETSKNFGCPGGPRNLGIKMARSKWIAFLDSDDIWHPDKLRIQVEVLEANHALFCSSEISRFVDGDVPKFISDSSKPTTKKIGFWTQMFNYQTPTSSVIVCSETIKKNLFEESIEFKAREDIDCWLRIHRSIRSSVKVCHPLVGYRLSPTQISGSKFKMVAKTFYCFNHTNALQYKLFGILPAILTVSHFITSIIKRLTKKSI